MMDTNSLKPGAFGPIGCSEVIVADTETTGLSPFGIGADGAPTGDPHGPDRLCSLAAITLHFEAGLWVAVDAQQWTLDPCRPVSEPAAKVNGFAWAPNGAAVPNGRRNLAGLPRFAAVAKDILACLGGRPLVFHNAVFDTAVIDAELARAGLPLLSAPILCTKKAFSDIQGLGRPDVYVPGTSLNKLCDLLRVNRSSRIADDGTELHGAEIDARLAAACFARLEPLGWMASEDAATLLHRGAIAGRRT